MRRTLIWVLPFFLLLWLVPVAFGAQMQLFGLSNVNGLLTFGYENFTQNYPNSSQVSSQLTQTYRLQMDTFVLHPKFLTVSLDGDFGLARRDGETDFDNRSYGTNFRFLRDFFITAGAGYQIGRDTVAVPYGPSYTRNREEQSADISLRLRHFPTSFTYKNINLDSTAQGHETDSTEQRLGLTTNYWFGQNWRGSVRLNSTAKTDRLAVETPKTQYNNLSLSNSWSAQDKRLSVYSGLQYYNKQLPESADNLNLSNRVTYRNDAGLSSSLNLSLLKNSRNELQEDRIGGQWNLKYPFTQYLTGQIDGGINKLQYQRPNKSDYVQDRYDLTGQLEYRVRTDGLTYYAQGSAGYLQRDVEGFGEISTVERVQLAEDGIIELKYPHVNGSSIVVTDTEELQYEVEILWVDADGFMTIKVIGEDLQNKEVEIRYSYTPPQDGKDLTGRIRAGIDKNVAENIMVSSYVAGDGKKSLLDPNADLTLSHELYVGAKADYQQFQLNGGFKSTATQNTLTGEVRYDQDSLSLTGRYANEYLGTDASRHNLSLNGRYYIYIPIGVRLTLQATEKRIYRNGELIDGDFNFSSNMRYPLRRYMWLKDDLKFTVSHLYDNSLRWSNLLGFEWRQGLFSLETGYELVGNQLTGYDSSKITAKLSRRF